MIRFLKNKFLNKENVKYTIAITIITIGIITMYTVKSMNVKSKGVVINSVRMLEVLENDNIGVYMDGEVKKEGYIKIKKGSTLEQAINKAGGITRKADIQNIDLKRVLKNQEKIIIPTIKEKFEEEEIDINESVNIVNINTSSKEELMELDGIGEKTAENIIAYRENNIFDTIEEIMEVKGIGKSKYSKIKDNITI